jgi:hypothetical protein
MIRKEDAVIAEFQQHDEAEAAIRKFAKAGLDLTLFSIVEKGYHTEENVRGFYNRSDRIAFWSRNGGIWGGLGGLVAGVVILHASGPDHGISLSDLTSVAASAIAGALTVGGLGALGAALVSAGLPQNSVISYEYELKPDGFLVVARGSAAEVAAATAVLQTEQST